MNVLHSHIIKDQRVFVVIDCLTDYTADFNIYRYEELEDGVPMFGQSHLPFEQALKDTKHGELTPELNGMLKWDGCMNWCTYQSIMAHACDIEDLEWVTPALIAVRRWVSTHIKAWDDGVAENV